MRYFQDPRLNIEALGAPLKVVERDHELHQGRSRMMEISLSGSGEGPGWATAHGYSTTLFLVNQKSTEEAAGYLIMPISGLKMRGFQPARRALPFSVPRMLPRMGIY